MRPFIAFIRKQPGSSGFGVCFPDLPHCNVAGPTIAEARQKAANALAMHWRRLRNTGEAFPIPSYMHELAWSQERITDGLVTLIAPPRPA